MANEHESPYRITDMIKAQIHVDLSQHMTLIYEELEMIPDKVFRIIKVKNNLQSAMQNVVLNFIYTNEIIGEFTLSWGTQ